MISFKQFILSEDNGSEAYIPKTLTPSEFVAWCKKNASQFLANKKKIYRGNSTRSTLYGYLDTRNFNRVSTNTHNYYTIFMDNHENWAAFPKRSKSLICANELRIAQGFGSTYFVIPSDSAKIGMCPGEDLWVSFPLKPIVGNADDLMSFTYALFKEFELPADSNLSYSDLIKNLKFLTLEKMMGFEVSAYDRTTKRTLDYMAHRQFESLYDLFVEVINPEDFRTTKASSYNLTADGEGNELWIQGECVVVSTTLNDTKQLRQIEDFGDRGFIQKIFE